MTRSKAPHAKPQTIGFFQELVRAVDQKGRVSLPPHYIQEDKGDLILLRHPEKPCIVGFYKDDLPESLSDMSLTSAFLRATRWDNDKRILLRVDERKKLETEKTNNIVFVGQEKHFVIWSEDGWKEQREAKARELASRLNMYI